MVFLSIPQLTNFINTIKQLINIQLGSEPLVGTLKQDNKSDRWRDMLRGEEGVSEDSIVREVWHKGAQVIREGEMSSTSLLLLPCLC